METLVFFIKAIVDMLYMMAGVLVPPIMFSLLISESNIVFVICLLVWVALLILTKNNDVSEWLE